jgi:L-histidine N-alpha-methyltransferase
VERFGLEVHLSPAEISTALARDVQVGLTSDPKWLPPKWFYDERGSMLFDEITRLPEYYPTRREKEILTAHAADIAAVSGADTLVELGSGTSEKTRWILDALRDTGRLRRFVPFDVDQATLRRAGETITQAYPGLTVDAVCGDFQRHLPMLPQGGRRVVALLGGTIGNLQPAERKTFFAEVRAGLEPGDSFLLGNDLVKDRERLIAAYDDAAGVTAAFNRNVLEVVNRSLGADFDPAAFDHVARWDDDEEWIEMHLVAREDLRVRIADLDLEVAFARGESMRTEISAKFRRQRIADELAEAGFEMRHWWTDQADDYALSLSVPV